MVDYKTSVMIEEAVHKAVREALIANGLNPDNPVKNQKMFSFLGAWQDMSGTIKRQGLLTVVTVIVPAVLAAIWLFFIKGPSQ